MSLPTSRRALYGRTFSQAWDAARYGSAVERFVGRRVSWYWIGQAAFATALGLSLVAFALDAMGALFIGGQ